MLYMPLQLLAFSAFTWITGQQEAYQAASPFIATISVDFSQR
jgi:hypothetical protein